MTAPLSPELQQSITGEVILKSAHNITVSCPWCRRIMRACDGTLTLAEIAKKLYLPLKVCEKLVTKAVEQNWLTVVTDEATDNTGTPDLKVTTGDTDFWFEINRTLHGSLGTAGIRLLQEAALMTRLNASELTPAKINDFLIALELVATDQERTTLNQYLDELRTRYAA